MPKPTFGKPKPPIREPDRPARKTPTAPVHVPSSMPPRQYAENMRYAAEGHPSFSASIHVKALAELVLLFAPAGVDQEWIDNHGARADVPNMSGPAYLSMYDPAEDYFRPLFGGVAPFFRLLDLKHRDGTITTEWTNQRSISELDKAGVIGWRYSKKTAEDEGTPSRQTVPAEQLKTTMLQDQRIANIKAGRPALASPKPVTPKPMMHAKPSLKPNISRLFDDED